MKSMKYIMGLSCLMGLFSGCNDSFMERYPEELSEYTFFNTAKDLELYANGFYSDSFHGIIGFLGGNSPYVFRDDCQSDNLADKNYNKLISGDVTTTAGGEGYWDYGPIRSCNFFLENYQRAQCTDAEKNRWAAEVKWWRAHYYFKMVKELGDVPWIGKTLTDISPELYAPRDPRTLVMDSVLADLNFAVKYLPKMSEVPQGRLSWEAACALKARICLFEGTFRKYHTEMSLPDAEKFLQAAAGIADTLITYSNLELYSTGNPDRDYYDMFSLKDVYSSPETILARQNIAERGNTHNISPQITTSQAGMTRSLVDAYLCTDGLPIWKSPNYDGTNYFTEIKNRDPRLLQTMETPGFQWKDKDGKVLRESERPEILQPTTRVCYTATGYLPVKFYQFEGSDNQNDNDFAYMRYGEVLLVYAEAKAELGNCQQPDLDKSINKLRKRVGMPDMRIDQLVYDDQTEFAKAGIVLEPLIQEIRRERRVELALEGLRYDDLMRWKAGKIFEKVPVRGLKVNGSEMDYLVKYTTGNFPRIKLDENGYVYPYYKTRPDEEWVFDESRDYLRAIPSEQLRLNRNLTQNPGWEDFRE